MAEGSSPTDKRMKLGHHECNVCCFLSLSLALPLPLPRTACVSASLLTNVERGILLSIREPGPFQKREHLRKSASVSGAGRAVDWAVPSVLPFHLPHSFLFVLGCKMNRLVFHARLPYKTKRANLRAHAQYLVLGAPPRGFEFKPLAQSMASRASTACPARAC